MSHCSIDAEYKGEERYSKLTLAYETPEDAKRINELIEHAIQKYDIKPETYHSKVSNGKDVIVIEYHDDYDREAGKIFEEMLASLNITCS